MNKTLPARLRRKSPSYGEQLVPLRRYLKDATKIVLNYHGQRNRVAREYFFNLLRRYCPIVSTDLSGISYLISTSDVGIGRSVFGTGEYETDIFRYALDVLDTELETPSPLDRMAVIDVGANIGTTTLPALIQFHFQHVIAFEPDPTSYQLLQHNVLENGVDTRVRALQVALSNVDAPGVLELCPSARADNRVRVVEHLPDGIFQESLRPTLPIALRRLDSVLSDLAISPEQIGLLWIDAQGHEGHILAGAPHLLSSNTPAVIEYWPYGLRRAGGVTLLHDAIHHHFSRVIDLRASMKTGKLITFSSGEMSVVEAGYAGVSYTDLLLLP